MNNRGFTLIEVLGVLVLIAIATIIAINGIHSTLSIGKEESYKLMKNSIISVSYDYIEECTIGTISCDFNFSNNNRFTARVLKDKGYFQDLSSPIDGKNLEDCLTIEATKENGVVVVNLVDECY